MDRYTPTPLTQTRRRPTRGHYDRATVHAILDEGLVCHVGYALGGQPVVTPTIYWRHDDRLYWHGSAASRMLRTLAAGVKASLAVTLMDGLVLARTAFHHSMNYRSVMAFGTARLVEDREHKLSALEHFLERLYPGRWQAMRPPTEAEIKATALVWMPLEEVSAKIRSGGPIDDAEDMGSPLWAGVIPLAVTAGAPVPDAGLDPAIAFPADLAGFRLTPKT